MAKATISKTQVDDATPSAKPYFLWDTKVSGFGVKILPSGSKTYLYQYRVAHPGEAATTTPKRITIGQHGPITAEQARTRAKELAVMIAGGTDPRQAQLDRKAAAAAAKALAETAAREADELAFERVAAQWLKDYAATPMKKTGKPRRESGVDQARIVVRKHLTPHLEGKSLPTITTSDIEAILSSIPAERQASRRTVAAYASVFFGWCERKRLIAESPVKGIDRPAAVPSRQRVLDADELRAIWWASQEIGQPWGGFYRLLALTGQRRNEVAQLQWHELDRAERVWFLPGDRAKNDNPHPVPLSQAAIAELDALAGVKPVKGKAIWPKSGFVLTTNNKAPISGFAKAKLAIDAEIAKQRDEKPIEDWRPHDLRRTLATGLQRLGVRFEVIEATLNHLSGKSGIVGVYQRHDWAEEKRAALDAWAGKVAGIVSDEPSGKVVQMQKRQRVRAAAQ